MHQYLDFFQKVIGSTGRCRPFADNMLNMLARHLAYESVADIFVPQKALDYAPISRVVSEQTEKISA